MRRMTRFRFSLLILAALVFTGAKTFAASTNTAPDFKEVFNLLRENLPEATETTLNQAAVDGLLAQFPGKVTLVDNNGAAIGAACVKSSIVESNFAYLRPASVSGDFTENLSAALKTLAESNTVAGVILDLRFADGDASVSASAAAKAIKTAFQPLAILINGGTRGAAETLAAALQTEKAGLLIGSPTAAETGTFRELPLSNGQRLRIATASVQSGTVIQPDIAVNVTPKEELEFLKNPYGTKAQTAANNLTDTNSFLPFIDRTSEADLVRQKVKDGDELPDVAKADAEPQPPMLQDPALARAVDFLKALAALHPLHS